MYLLYLVTALSLVVGVGAFAPYDKEARQADQADNNRIEIASRAQLRFARALRLAYEMDPSSFPSPSAGEYKRIRKNKIAALIDFPGYLDMDMSQFYLDPVGNVIGVMTEGPLAPVDGNGDLVAGVSAPPLFVKDFLLDLYGKDINEGPFGKRKIGEYDTGLHVDPGKDKPDGTTALSLSDDDFKDVLSEVDFASIPEAYVTGITKLDVSKSTLEAEASIASSATPAADLVIALAPRKTSFSLGPADDD